MKKLSILLFAFLLSIPLFGQQKLENDDLYYTTKSDTNKHAKRLRNKVNTLYSKDTLQYSDVNTDEDPFVYSNRIAMFYHGGFNPWYYNDLFYYNSFFFDDFWFDWGYPYNTFYFGLEWPWYNNFWYRPYWYPYYHNHNYWHDGGGYHNHANINRRQSYSTLTNHYGVSRSNPLQTKQNYNIQNRRVINTGPQNKSAYSQNNRRSYTPSYGNLKMTERPNFNNTHTYNNIQNRSINHTNTVRSSTVRNYSSPSRSNYQHNSNSSYRPSGSNYSGGGSYRSSGSSFSGSRSGISHSSNNSGGGGSRRR